jgi:GTP-binding protein
MYYCEVTKCRQLSTKVPKLAHFCYHTDMLVDYAEITVKAGNGGRGNTSTLQKRPYGGDGGRGGSVYLVGSENIVDLGAFRSTTHFEAENGAAGMEADKHGGDGADIDVLVPVGTEIRKDGLLVATITKHGQRELIAKGLRGSIGNISLKKHPQWIVATQEEITAEKITIILDYKLTAEILFMGYPNAGKSSMLNKLSRAKAKVAAYPFTTLEPQLGRMNGIRLMDLPGLIDGTHVGRGLGTEFLKHTERSKIVAHFVSLEHEKPMDMYKKLRKEIKAIDITLFEKPEVIILTKYDERDAKFIAKVKKQFEKLKKPLVVCSIIDDASIQACATMFEETLASLPVDVPPVSEVPTAETSIEDPLA